MLLPHLSYHASFGHSRSNHRSLIVKIPSPPKMWPLTSRLKFIGNGTNRSATYDFLLVFRSNYGPISYRFRDKGRYLQIFPTPFLFNAPLSRFPWNFVTAVGSKTGITLLHFRKVKCDDMSIRLDTAPALDRQTDIQTELVKQYRVLYA